MRLRRLQLMVVAVAAPAPSPAPAVSVVTAGSAIEGSNIVHTVTLSSPPSSSATFSLSLVGVTATAGGVDFTSTLTSSAFSNGVTIAGGTITVPAGVSSFTVTVPTTPDTDVEPNETYTLTVGGVSASGTINDNDVPPATGDPLTDAPGPVGSASFTIDFEAMNGVDGVVVLYGTTSRASDDPSGYLFRKLFPGNGLTSATVPNLAVGTYHCRVAGYTGMTLGPLSQQITKTAA